MSQGIWITLTYAVLFLRSHLVSAQQWTTFTIKNKCNETVWPVLLSSAGAQPWFPERGFLPLPPGKSESRSVPANWTGKLWGQILCDQESSGSTTFGRFSCATGDVCSPAECPIGDNTTTTIAEFALNGGTGGDRLDTYSVSLAHGFNLPMAVVPRGGTAGNCAETGCVIDLNENCPKEMRVFNGKRTVGCRRACNVYGDSNGGDSAVSSDCKENSEFFGEFCPLGSVTHTCASKDYAVTFCPTLPELSATTAPSNEFKSKNGMKSFTALQGVGILLAALSTLALVVFTVRWLSGRETNLLDVLNPQRTDIELNVITCVKIG